MLSLRFYRLFWSEAVHDRRKGFENKTNEPTCFPRGKWCSEDETNRYVYIYIGHDSSVGVCFAKEMTAHLAEYAMLSFLPVSR